MSNISLQKRRELHQMLDALLDDKSEGIDGTHGVIMLRETTLPDGKHTLAARGWVSRRARELPAALRKLR